MSWRRSVTAIRRSRWSTYAQVLKRRDREQIGRAFDQLLVGGGGREPRTAARAARRPAERSEMAARRRRNPG
jgi:hypothetical protein